jgi:hypothetical protein
MSYTLELVLTSGVEPESPGSQPSTLPLSYISMVPMGLNRTTDTPCMKRLLYR